MSHGFLADLLYPDNQHRADRASQLFRDCEALIVELGRQKYALEAAFQELDKTFRQAIPPGYDDLHKEIQFRPAQDWIISLPEVVQPLIPIAKDGVSYALMAASPIGVSTFFLNSFGLPEGFPRTQLSGGFDLKELFGLVPAAIDGAVIRNQLRGMIKSLLASRLQMKRVELSNKALIESLIGLSGFVSVAVSTTEVSYPEANDRIPVLTKVISTYVAKLRQAIGSVSDADAARELLLLDENRNAWRAEDDWN